VLPLPPLGLGMLSLACTRRRATHHLRAAERYAVQRALCERRCPRRLVLLHKGVYAQPLPASRGSLNRFPQCEALVMLCNAPLTFPMPKGRGCSRPAGESSRGGVDTCSTGAALRDGPARPKPPAWQQGGPRSTPTKQLPNRVEHKRTRRRYPHA